MKGKKYSFFKILLIGFIIFGGIKGSYTLYDFLKEKKLPYNLHELIGNQEGNEIENWVYFNPKEMGFSVLFPTEKPEHLSSQLPIPRSDGFLPYEEYRSREKSIVASVSYTVLPDQWLKWGSSFILKGALKMIVNETKGAHLVGKSSNTFKSHPALDFEHYLGNQETAGTLILAKNILYKIEISYPLDHRKEAHNKLCLFIKSFNPHSTPMNRSTS